MASVASVTASHTPTCEWDPDALSVTNECGTLKVDVLVAKTERAMTQTGVKREALAGDGLTTSATDLPPPPPRLLTFFPRNPLPMATPNLSSQPSFI